MPEVEAQQMVTNLLAPEIVEMLDQHQNDLARASLVELLDPEAADLLMALGPEHRRLAFLLLPRERAAGVFSYLPVEEQETLLSQVRPEQLAAMFNAMPPDDRAMVFDELPERVSARLLQQLRPEERALTETILSYPPGSIGRVMTTEFLRLEPDWTVQQASQYVRQHAKEAETIETCYVVDKRGRLLDDVRLRQLFLADPAATIDSIIDGVVVSLRATHDQEEAVRVLDKYDRPVLPVVDDHDVLVGIVTFDDIADVAQEETTEDFQKFGGVEALDQPYITSSIGYLFRKRGVWLSVLFVGELLTATAMQYFAKEIEHAAMLALFLPLIISSGGNSGSQASTLVIRAMALREVRLRDWLRVMRREIACGLLLGLLLGAIGLMRIHLWQWMGMFDYGRYYHRVGLTVAAALVGVVLWGTLMGSMLPFLLRWLKLDPASISAPLVATLVDVTGLIIYFTTAMVVLRGTML
jgi:magnesium transporter